MIKFYIKRLTVFTLKLILFFIFIKIVKQLLVILIVKLFFVIILRIRSCKFLFHFRFNVNSKAVYLAEKSFKWIQLTFLKNLKFIKNVKTFSSDLLR